jgi:post-segregation antitoxin (ccd killing protein)
MKQKRKRATFTLPASLKRRLKIAAAREGVNMSKITEDALRRELNERDAERDEARRPQHEAA